MTLIILCAGSCAFGALIVVFALWAQKLSHVISSQWWERRNAEWPDQPNFASGHAQRDRSDANPKDPASPQPVPSAASGHPTGSPSKSGNPLAVSFAKNLENGGAIRRVL
jgi:hypothetical protein